MLVGASLIFGGAIIAYCGHCEIDAQLEIMVLL